jgi:hypothetical protein
MRVETILVAVEFEDVKIENPQMFVVPEAFATYAYSFGAVCRDSVPPLGLRDVETAAQQQ